MSMFKSKAEFKRAPQVSKYYDLEESIGVASRLKELQDMKLRVEEAENRAKNIRLRMTGWNIRRKHFIKVSLMMLIDS